MNKSKSANDWVEEYEQLEERVEHLEFQDKLTSLAILFLSLVLFALAVWVVIR